MANRTMGLAALTLQIFARESSSMQSISPSGVVVKIKPSPRALGYPFCLRSAYHRRDEEPFKLGSLQSSRPLAKSPDIAPNSKGSSNEYHVLGGTTASGARPEGEKSRSPCDALIRVVGDRNSARLTGDVVMRGNATISATTAVPISISDTTRRRIRLMIRL